ncbi:hypothetical protein ABIC63_000508 [Pseudacidovorax sp. 1753]|uniref:hypothetical protein n=1 Tax=Pseudacidovorax sp. 1753 TaxID=3156419 RepID=UPI0033908A10
MAYPQTSSSFDHTLTLELPSAAPLTLEVRAQFQVASIGQDGLALSIQNGAEYVQVRLSPGASNVRRRCSYDGGGSVSTPAPNAGTQPFTLRITWDETGARCLYEPDSGSAFTIDLPAAPLEATSTVFSLQCYAVPAGGVSMLVDYVDIGQEEGSASEFWTSVIGAVEVV